MLIPVQKKFTRSSSSRFAKPSKQTVFSKPRIPYRTLLIIFAIFIAFYGIFLLLKYTLFVPEYTITKVDYALSNVQKYDDPYLYKLISTLVKGENYRVIQWHEASLLKQIQTQYPFIKTFVVSYRGPNNVFVKLTFEEPKLVVFQGDFRYAVYQDHFFQLFSGNTLGADALRVELFPTSDRVPVIGPESHTSLKIHTGSLTTGSTITGSLVSGAMLSGINYPLVAASSSGSQAHGALTGLFYMEDFDSFIADMEILKQAFPNAQYFKYLVGGQRIIVGLPRDVMVYINLPVDIHLQIQNYNNLRQYYADFSKLREIDLGSIEMDKVIVRK